MKPGEFVVLYRDAAHPEWNCIEPDDLRFPAAVAALQSLIRPKQAVPFAGVHPGVGLRWCGEEEPGHSRLRRRSTLRTGAYMSVIGFVLIGWLVGWIMAWGVVLMLERYLG